MIWMPPNQSSNDNKQEPAVPALLLNLNEAGGALLNRANPIETGAHHRNRTCDLTLTKGVLYRLS
ncbi:MAG: hypothetical protein JWR16_2771 [Nevskia sp.]|nr:hypothetical protein [Nevskia sp.]